MAYSTINKYTDYFNTVLYTGNGSNNHTITGVGFNTDLAWIKNRGGDDHRWFDKVRGVTKYIESNNTGAEVTDAIFTTNSDGYVVTDAGEVNANSGNFVGWNWLANGAGSANTDGGINSTVSVNTTAGFSIVSYTGNGSAGGSTIGHGLNAVPKMFIIKNRSTAKDWTVYHNSISAENYVELNTTIASTDSSSIFNDTAPTSSVFTIGNNGQVNTSGDNYIAYCFAEVPGYSKFGSYTGNGNVDGPFIYTGFKPAFVITKVSSGSTVQGWLVRDNKRNPFNVSDTVLPANNNSADVVNAGSYGVDLLSNGFKIRGTDGGVNQNGGTLIYMAFGQSIVGSNNIPATAR